MSTLSPLEGKLATDLQDFDLRKRSISIGSNLGHVVKDVYYWEPKSLRIRTINWSYVFLAEYLPYAYGFSIAAVGVLLAYRLYMWRLDELMRIWSLLQDPLMMQVIGAAALIVAYASQHKSSIYCLENIVFKPPEEWQVSREEVLTMMRAQGCFNDSSMEFQERILDNSGTGESTHWPPGSLRSKDGMTKGQCDMEAARDEAHIVIFELVTELLKRTRVKPQKIDFLIINCSLFCPTPSLCAMVCNKFGLRQDIRSYNLGGMGCSANVISVDLAKQLLENRPGSLALVVSTENITQNLYRGNQKSMLLQNTLFRCGGCALMLSSRMSDSMRAKYKLLYTFRTQLSDDNSYNCVFQKEDNEGNSGVALSKDIVKVAGRAMRQNFVQLGPHVLPLREQAKVLCNQFVMRLVSQAKKRSWPFADRLSVPQGYTPNFSKGIDHFCIHAGGRAVIEGVQQNLNLSDRQIRPSVQTLHDWGNTSSSSIWYETDWIERFGDLHPGERILQISFGSGFKCNSAVWVALRVDKSKQGQPLKDEVAEPLVSNGDACATSENGVAVNGKSCHTNGKSIPTNGKHEEKKSQ
ncbi:KCS9 [Symbiodinium sp. KB8]|nr:KCS9 [Symbiodinium sp. KB8]